ncbi:MAG: hemolysin III family protein [Burkholderiales bacterium]|nr:hemolysin III family protein [Burkholderiales bacterium]
MTARGVALDERSQTLGEEIANSISHGVGLVAAIVAFPFVVMAAAARGSTSGIIAASIFATTMVLLYLSSTIFHALPEGRAKRVFQVLDHAAIFLLIAGTYTPFTLGVLHGVWGWTLFSIVWSVAAVGIVLKSIGGVRYNTISTWAYLAMGWVVVIAAERLWTLMPAWGLFWLFAGGLAYTLGAVFFLLERIRYFHFAWHLFVVAGTACHVVAVMAYSG